MKFVQALAERQTYSRVNRADDSEKGSEDGTAIQATARHTLQSFVSWSYLLLTVINIVGCVGWYLRKSCPVQTVTGLASDQMFGDIPTDMLMWKEDPKFRDSDPWNGQYWNNGTAAKGHTPWDDLYRSGWIEVETPSRYGLSGGVPLSKFAAAGTTFAEDAQGFNVAVLHQLHCIGTLKHLIESGDDELLGHSQHCIEYLRQSVMCNADLTLEPPAWIGDNRIKGTTGWGNQHYCRDWKAVHDALWSRLIRFIPDGSAMRVIRDR